MIEHIGCYLKDIYLNKKSGRLIFHYKDIQKYLFFQDGFLIFAKTNQRQELLGEVLFKLGKISENNYAQIEDYIEPKKNIGQALISLGLITEQDLQEGLSYQIREIVLNIFPYFEGEFKFQPIQGFFEQVLEKKIDLPLLIEDGIRRMKFNPSLQGLLQERIPVLKGKEFFYRLTEEERGILAIVDGSSSGAVLFPQAKVSPEVFWKSLFLLYCLDLIDFKSQDKSSVEVKEEAIPDEVHQSLDEIIRLSEDLSQMNYYQILKIEPTASKAEIKKAYFQLARRYHPDLFGGDIHPEILDKTKEIFSYITKAYSVLNDENKRRNYDSDLAVLSPEDKKGAAKKAETKFRKAKTLYDMGIYEDALILLGEAIRLVPNQGNYYLLRALIEAKIDGLHKKAEEDFLRALKLSPWNPEAYVGLGLLYKKEGFRIKSRKQFEKALSLDPEHKIALRELNVSPTKEKKKGFSLKDILTMEVFGKKKK
ncbi:MAG: DnaJ domain-containing protein [Candidatus Aminicenantales bacterium]